METGNAEIVGATMEKALLCLRVMRKLTVHGFKAPHQCNSVMEFVQSIYERIKHLLQYREINLLVALRDVMCMIQMLFCRSNGTFK